MAERRVLLSCAERRQLPCDPLVFMAEPGSPRQAKLRRLITMAGG